MPGLQTSKEKSEENKVDGESMIEKQHGNGNDNGNGNGNDHGNGHAIVTGRSRLCHVV